MAESYLNLILNGQMLMAAGLSLAGLYLIERRGQPQPLGAWRHVELGILLDSIPEATVMFDAAGQVIDANLVACQLAGVFRDQLRGRTAAELARMLWFEVAPPGKELESILARALKGEVIRRERRVLRHRHTGETNELLISASPVRSHQGGMLGALIMARDVTELTDLQRRMADLERHNAIGQMAAALAHDFNNLLDTVGQAASLLEMNQERPPEERKLLLDMILNTVRRGGEIIGRVREYLRTGSGAIELVDIPQIMQECVELTRPLWAKANLKAKTELKSVPQVRANQSDLRRVLTNLIINAIEAMPQGGQLTVACEERSGKVIATITDTGIGIPPESQKKIFFPYFTTKPKGTGLGLSGAQKMVLEQGGRITFSSEPGKGTQFTIQWPAAEGQKQTPAA